MNARVLSPAGPGRIRKPRVHPRAFRDCSMGACRQFLIPTDRTTLEEALSYVASQLEGRPRWSEQKAIANLKRMGYKASDTDS